MHLDARALIWLCLPALLTGCDDPPPALMGTLEWDRVTVRAEAAEPVLDWAVIEGQNVAANAVLLHQDPRRQQARLSAAEANLQQAEARLRELANGARVEEVEAARAELSRARAAQQDAEREDQRISRLADQGVVSAAARDQARARRDQRRAETAAAAAHLKALTRGTRPEQIEQAAAAVAAAAAAVDGERLTLDRLTVRAPVAGRIDALPFKPGDHPATGATLASLLVGSAPYARVFVPTAQRLSLAVGTTMTVTLGEDGPHYTGIVEHLGREPVFTPYYALSGDDASRMVYRAEIRLQGDGVAELPAGLPLSARITGHGGD